MTAPVRTAPKTPVKTEQSAHELDLRAQLSRALSERLDAAKR